MAEKKKTRPGALASRGVAGLIESKVDRAAGSLPSFESKFLFAYV